MSAEQRAEAVRQGLESLVSEVDKSQFRPLQKESFLCQARCCDTAQAQADLRNCCDHCNAVVEAAQQSVQAQLQAFTERLQRCSVRCRDKAQETLPVSPTEAQVAKAQSRLADCVGDCAAEYGKQLPKLKADIHAEIKQLTRSR